MLKNHKNKNQKIIITAGPTIEHIDPVRYISNWSSGTMGYLIAGIMFDKGFNVILISGPVDLVPPDGVKAVYVKTAEEMNKAVKKEIKGASCIIATAAVSDFRVLKPKKQKIKKKEHMTLKLVRNVDILAELKKNENIVKIGFALETENVLKNGKKKIREKGLDFIIVNRLSSQENPFGKDLAKDGKRIKRNYNIVYKDGNIKSFSAVSKKTMAAKIAGEAEKWVKKK